MQTTFTIAILPGDGIGIDVIAEAVKVLRAVQGAFHPEDDDVSFGCDLLPTDRQ